MLGQPISMLLPQVIGFKLDGELPEGSTATDLVLTVTEMLREKGVVSKFVEFFGPGLQNLPLADRATIGNMSPEFGSTCAIFPDRRRDAPLPRVHGPPDRADRAGRRLHARAGPLPRARLRGRDLQRHARARPGRRRAQHRRARSARRTGSLWPTRSRPSSRRCRNGTPRPASSSGTRSTRRSSESFPASDPPAEDHDNDARQAATGEERRGGHRAAASDRRRDRGPARERRERRARPRPRRDRRDHELHQHLEPLGDARRRAWSPRRRVERGLERQPWVKTSLAPGSTVVTEYLEKSGLDKYLNELQFNLVGYGCTTCIGNSGPLPEEISKAVSEKDLVVCSVLSGNRNFEGRINPDTRANYLASPPLVVAYALAGRMDIDLTDRAARPRRRRRARLPERHLAHLAPRSPTPSSRRSAPTCSRRATPTSSPATSAGSRSRSPRATATPGPTRPTCAARPSSRAWRPSPTPVEPVEGARVLAVLGDSVTTDHISPAGAIKKDSPAGQWLIENGVEVRDFNSYGARRGNHEVMIRGTFANVRLRNRLVEKEGGFTKKFPEARGDHDLRGRDGLRRGGHAAGRPRRQGVRLGLIARLGRQGHRPARASAP